MRRGETMSLLEPAERAPVRRSGELTRSWRDTLEEQQAELWEGVRHIGDQPRSNLSEGATYVLGDAIQ